MKRLFLFLLVSAMLLSCNKSKKFNSEEWKRPTDITYENRKDMVDDLINSKILIGKRPKDVIDLLGQPEYSEEYAYKVYQKFHFIDVIESVSLNIHYSPDSLVQNVEVEEWKHD